MRAIWLRSAAIAPAGTAEHACLLDSQLGQANCTAGVWCQKGQYKFTISSNCAPARFGEQQQGTDNACSEYVITATPINSNVGAPQLLFRIGCGHSITFRITAATPPTAEECQGWTPL